MKKIHILATGGTISARGPAGRTAGYQDGAFRIEQLLEGVEGAAALARITGEQIFTLSSEEMTGAHWLTLARRINQLAEEGEADGFVITHGTNTLEETAYFLHLTVKTDRPVVLTGSMRPATANSADGAQNLYEAIAVAASGEARGKGVLVVFSGPMPSTAGTSAAWATCRTTCRYFSKRRQKTTPSAPPFKPRGSRPCPRWKSLTFTRTRTRASSPCWPGGPGDW